MKAPIWAWKLNTQRDVRFKIQALKTSVAKQENKNIRCTEINFTNDRCHICSYSNNFIVLYDFVSVTNGLQWQERRCRQKKCVWQQFNSINSTIEFPRCVANIQLSITQMENVCNALRLFGIVATNPYKYIFKDRIKQETKSAKYYFIPCNAIARCGHGPSHLKSRKPCDKYIKYNGPYSIYCNECGCYYDISSVCQL